jgi:tripartite-type tricarboxylate transporter receptor subunit TctC
MEMFRSAAKVEMVHVPYKGAGAAMTDLMAGQVTVLFSSVLGALPVVKSGRVRGLAVSGPRRIATAPDIPTVAESGLPGFESMFFLGLLGPVGLPREVVTRLHAETAAILQRREVQDWFALQGVEPAAGTPEQFAARIRADMDKIERSYGKRA